MSKPDVVHQSHLCSGPNFRLIRVESHKISQTTDKVTHTTKCTLVTANGNMAGKPETVCLLVLM